MNNFGIPSLPEGMAGCVTKEGYSYVQNRSADRLFALKGRPRYRLKDANASYHVTVNMEATQAQFNTFQSLWNGPIQRGNNQFIMRLTMDAALIYNAANEAYVVRAVEPWSANNVSWDRWVITMTVEVPAAIAYQITICDVIYGGPITDLAADDIYGGPITNLATDIIAPCEGVNP